MKCKTQQSSLKSSFRFQAMWCHNVELLDNIKRCWETPLSPYSRGLFGFYFKLKRLKQTLKKWNKESFGNIFVDITRAEEDALKKEIIYDRSKNPNDRKEVNEAYAKLNRLLSKEEAYWKQKAGIKWLNEGDNNSKFFHAWVRKKCAKNNITSITNEGVILKEPREIQTSAMDYFERILTRESTGNCDRILDNIPQLVTQSDNDLLNRAPDIEEIKEVVFSINKESAAGPNGYSSLFYQYSWEIITLDLLDAIQDFFNGRVISTGITSTSIILIPKKAEAKEWKDFRPISLCNVINKILTKVMSSRLNKILPRIISASQSGFTPGRDIGDNILLAQELIQNIDRKTRGGNAVLKLDMAKAYDRVDWEFLFKVMEKFGFNQDWIDKIKRSINNCGFSILINGELKGYFKSTRGLRQGDPISPSLFIILAECLSRGLYYLFYNNVDLQFRYGGRIPVSHLAFADDIVIFTNGQKSSLNKIMKFISHYTESSGWAINCNKSSLYTRREIHRNVIAENTGFQYLPLPMIYLGVPLYKGHKRAVLFEELISKIKRRILGWEHRWLSAGGRISLINHVLSSMPIHLLQILDPPQCAINKISRLFTSFIWGDSSQYKKIHWASWDKICYPTEEGGIGCKSISDLNLAFDCKLWWKFREQKSLWSQVLLAKYCRNNHASAANHRSTDSGVWNRMLKAKNIAEPYIAWRIGEGKINIKFDIWLKSGSFQGRLTQDLPQDKLVRDFRNSNGWDTTLLNSILPAEVVNEIVKIPDTKLPDKMFWIPNSSGEFSISSCINLFRQDKSTQLAYKNI